MTTQSQLKLLVNLALIDGEVAEREKKYIINIGVANGLMEQDVKPLFDQEHEVMLSDDLNKDQKFDYLFSLVQLMKIDGRLYKDEIKYCAQVATKLGYKKEVMIELMLKVSATMKDVEVQSLKELTSSYLTR